MPQPGLLEFVVIAVPFLMGVGVALLILRALRTSGSARPRDPALDALRTRFAAGEIDETEFERRRSILRHS